jgi:hypothetical protein
MSSQRPDAPTDTSPVTSPATDQPSPALYVREASLRFRMPMPVRPVNPGSALAESRQQLVDQAVDALRQATDPWDYPTGTAPAVDVAAVAEALADLVLVAYGTAAAYGIGLDPVIAEVHRANLSQRRANAHGHTRQGSNYSPPYVAAVLAGQRDGSDPSDRDWWTEQVIDAAAMNDDEIDHEAAGQWLDTPHPALDRQTPWSVIAGGAGWTIWRLLDSRCDQSDARVA